MKAPSPLGNSFPKGCSYASRVHGLRERRKIVGLKAVFFGAVANVDALHVGPLPLGLFYSVIASIWVIIS